MYNTWRESGIRAIPGLQSQCMRHCVGHCTSGRLLLLLVSSALVFAQKKPFDVNALLELKRIGDPQISPDGRLVAFTVQTVDAAANKKPVQIWTVPLDGGTTRQITHDGESNQRP